MPIGHRTPRPEPAPRPVRVVVDMATVEWTDEAIRRLLAAVAAYEHKHGATPTQEETDHA